MIKEKIYVQVTKLLKSSPPLKLHKQIQNRYNKWQHKTIIIQGIKVKWT